MRQVCGRLQPRIPARGRAIEDFKRPDRIVIGTNDARAPGVMAEVYRPLYLNGADPVHHRRTAELIKYAANAFLATKITFINEIADLVREGRRQRAGGGPRHRSRQPHRRKFLHAGPGYGGSCFPKDTMALIRTAQDHGAPMRIVETVVAVNDQRKRPWRARSAMLGGSVRGKTIAVLGLTFKPNTDECATRRPSRSSRALQDMGADVRAYDPAGMTQARKALQNGTYTS